MNKARQRVLLESSRRFRRWLSYGLALPSGYVAKMCGARGKTVWKEMGRAPRVGFWSRSTGARRMLIEAAAPVLPEAPRCIQTGNPGGFPPGKTFPSAPAFVHWLPSVIYHGLHGAIMDGRGSVYTELLDGTFENLDLGEIKERALTFKGRVMALSCSKNYFHCLLKMLPRLYLLERAEGGLEQIEAFLINRPTWQQEQVYRRLNIWERCVIIDRKTFAVCRLLAAPTIAHDGPDWACGFIRKKLGPAEGSAPGRRRIYVVRGKTAHRELVNEQEVSMLLRSYGFEIVDCSILTVEEQAGLFAQSAVIVGVHGAAFSNLVFCNPGAIVLEIFGTPKNQKGYWVMSHRMGLRYHYLMAESVESEAAGNMANIAVDLKVLAGSVEVILGQAEAGAVKVS